MPNILSALLPPSPLLIDEIGKNNKQVLAATEKAYQLIAEKIKEAEVKNIIIISPHGPLLTDRFSLGLAPQFTITFNQFGCFKKRPAIKSALILIDSFLATIKQDFPCQLIAQPALDYGSAIPSLLLSKEQPEIKLMPLFPAKDLSYLDHYNFGLTLGEFIASRPEKIALIAAGNLSHRLKVSSPGGFSPKGAKFDKKIIEYLNQPNRAKEKLLKLDKQKVAEAKECVLKPLLILLGAIGDNYVAKKLAYQTDFGIGYLSYLFNKQNS